MPSHRSDAWHGSMKLPRIPGFERLTDLLHQEARPLFPGDPSVGIRSVVYRLITTLAIVVIGSFLLLTVALAVGIWAGVY